MRGEKQAKKKPKYNMFQNSWFMIKLAWKQKEKKVILTGILLVLLGVATNLIDLYIAPTILKAIETNASFGELMSTILVFITALVLTYGFNSYIKTNVLYGRVTVRTEIIAMLNNKACKTSYPNIENEEFYKLSVQASDKCNSNSQATEAIWDTLIMLLKNIICFIFYTGLLLMVKPLMLVIILVTTLIGFFINNYLSEYTYKKKEFEAEQDKKLYYINRVSSSIDYAKDIRIFGLRPWLTELHMKSMDLLHAFYNKAYGVYLWARIADLVLAFLRNTVAYVYLIGLVVDNQISVAEFLLYFSAVSGFTTLVTGVLSQLNRLKKQSLDISIVREALEYPEVFKFEDILDIWQYL